MFPRASGDGGIQGALCGPMSRRKAAGARGGPYLRGVFSVFVIPGPVPPGLHAGYVSARSL